MKDLLNNEIKIGDKVAFLPNQKWTPRKIQYGIVESMTKDNHAAYSKTLNNNKNAIIRYSDQIIKKKKKNETRR